MISPMEKRSQIDPKLNEKFIKTEMQRKELEKRVEAQLKYLIRSRKFSFVC
jgi:hypothetical protein